MDCRFRVLGLDVGLRGPRRPLEPIARAYRRFVSDADGGADVAWLELSDDASAVSVDGRRTPLIAELDTTLQVYQLFLNFLMDRIDSHAVLHAAALVAPGGRALLVAAPSGHGKSSLALELAHRGFGFLGDDFAPLDLQQATIAPYPRAVSVVPRGAAPLPAPFQDRLRDDAPVHLFDKQLLDVGDVLGEATVATAPAPLGTVVLLAAGQTPRDGLAETLIDVVGRIEEAPGLDADFAATPGVEVAARNENAPLCHWKLRLDHEKGPTRALSPILDGERVLFADKYWDLQPDFSSEPAAEPIGRREAAEALGRELLNRRSHGKLLERYEGQVPLLFLDLVGALRRARCWRVRVGRFAPTVELIRRLAAESG